MGVSRGEVGGSKEADIVRDEGIVEDYLQSWDFNADERVVSNSIAHE